MGGFFQKQKSISELEEETEHLEAENRLASAEFSLEQKKQMSAELKSRGLTPKHFGLDWKKIKEWIKTH